jgi:conjugal transfer pilus assembly protein TraD
MKPTQPDSTYELKVALMIAGGAGFYKVYDSLTVFDRILMMTGTTALLTIAGLYAWDNFSKLGREQKKRLEHLKTVPISLLKRDQKSVCMGLDQELRATIFLPDSIRSRHVHLVGATGSGKTESVILNFLQQDVARGFGSIILDAKGDASFLDELKTWVPESQLKIFDLSCAQSLGYDPLEVGSALESAQRLFSSLTWSEEYYKSKALSTLQRLFRLHYEKFGRNPRLIELSAYLETPMSYAAVTFSENYPKKMAEADFVELSGLRDQIKSLCIGHLSQTLSPEGDSKINLREAATGTVIYFRLQSLLSPQLVSVLGKLVINHLSYLAGTSHREVQSERGMRPFIPVYFDEFASFACPEFADLISKARSAGYALHFSHQSTGDLAEVSKGFLNQITDNSATKIIMRINDPDSAEFFARSFGTKLYQKITQRITNAKEVDTGEAMGEGSQREAHQFRASPDLFKTLPTGMGSVLIAHGEHTDLGASHVFKIKFPKLNRKEN